MIAGSLYVVDLKRRLGQLGYELVGSLGEGAYGVVFEAFDSKRGANVALKVLRRSGALDVARFKREFRSLADITHAHLVTLFDFVAADDLSFFTMQLVPGKPFSEVGPFESARLTKLVAQLTDGVAALHGAGKLHRDLKPSNVLVTDDDHVVIVDFGLVGDLAEQQCDASLGTFGYMAPEQTRRLPLTEGADWYAVGAMLHEALVGHPPLGGRVAKAIKTASDPLSALCASLLRDDPAQRSKGGRDLQPTPFVGRTRERHYLQQAWVDRAAVVSVSGASGLGKTKLVRHFLAEHATDSLVLSGRCRERESIPYKAFDEIVAALAQIQTDPVADDLAHMFPVLRARGDEQPTDPQQQRRRAFTALRELLRGLATTRRVILFIDDLHWIDRDSVALLEEIMRQPDAPALLLIVSYRDEPANPLLQASLHALGTQSRHMKLAPLTDEDANDLAAQLVPMEAIEGIVSEAQGSPLLLEQLARYGARNAGDLSTLVQKQIDDLPGPALQLLQTLAVAEGPLDESIAFDAAQIERSVSRRTLIAAINARLVITGPRLTVDFANESIRKTMTAHLTVEATKTFHLRLAQQLESTSGAPERIVHHFCAADQPVRAAEHILPAAERARAVLAFEREADLLERAQSLPVSIPRWRLLALHAEALVNAGRGAAASERFQLAASLAPLPDDRMTFARRAGEHAVRSGRIEEGTAVLRGVLARVGVWLPKSRGAAMVLSLILRVCFLIRGTRFSARKVACNEQRLDIMWSITTSLSVLDFVRTDALGLRHLFAALRAGSASHVTRSLAFEATREVVLDGRFFQDRSARLLSRAAALAETPYEHAWVELAGGICAWFQADWRSVVLRCDEARRLFQEKCRGVAWELAMTDVFALPALAALGEIKTISARVPERLLMADGRGDRFAATVLRMGHQNLIHLAADDIDRARAEASLGAEALPQNDHSLYYALLAFVQIDLYANDGAAAWSRIEAAWPKLKAAQLLRVRCLRSEIFHLRGRAALACLQARPELSAVVEDAIDHIERDSVPSAAPLADALRAGLLGADRLRGCIEGFERASMWLFADAARHHLGEPTPFLHAQGIMHPAAFARLLLPGFDQLKRSK